ncbi:MAG: hypothetical protein D6814_11930, partial [Calditrichaeota bacterium]
GKIALPVIGQMTSAGLTISQLSAKIAEKMSLFNPRVTQALVRVLEYGSKRLYITGAVQMPGPKTFERMPNVWEAILAAGGPLETAALDKVMIIRGGDTYGQTIPVDLTAFFDQGDLTKLPDLRPNDNIYVPTNAPAGGAAGAGGAGVANGGNLFSRKEVVYVYGYVAAPGMYQLEKDMDVLQALVKAGGPVIGAGGNRTGLAAIPDLKSVKLITHSPEGPVVYEIDLENYAKKGVPNPLRLRPGDTVYVPYQQSFSKFIFSNALRTAVTGTISIIVSYILLNRLLK